MPIDYKKKYFKLLKKYDKLMDKRESHFFISCAYWIRLARKCLTKEQQDKIDKIVPEVKADE